MWSDDFEFGIFDRAIYNNGRGIDMRGQEAALLSFVPAPESRPASLAALVKPWERLTGINYSMLSTAVVFQRIVIENNPAGLVLSFATVGNVHF